MKDVLNETCPRCGGKLCRDQKTEDFLLFCVACNVRYIPDRESEVFSIKEYRLQRDRIKLDADFDTLITDQEKKSFSAGIRQFEEQFPRAVHDPIFQWKILESKTEGFRKWYDGFDEARTRLTERTDFVSDADADIAKDFIAASERLAKSGVLMKHIARHKKRIIRRTVLVMLLVLCGIAAFLWQAGFLSKWFHSVNLKDPETGITLSGNDHTLPRGTTLTVRELSTADASGQKVIGMLSDEIGQYRIYNINATMKTQYADDIRITIPIPASFDPQKMTVYYFDGNDRVTELPTEVGKKSVSFTTSHCSIYLVAEKVSKGLEYAYQEDRTYAVTGYSGNETAIRIPKTYNGLPITGIAANAFRGREEITSVILPDTMEHLAASAFANCLSIRTLTVPKTVTNIEKNAFEGWTSDQTLFFEGRGIPASSWNTEWNGDCRATLSWELTAFPIRYELNGGTNAPGNPTFYTKDSETIVPAAPARVGYSFSGWFTDKGFTEEFTDIPAGSEGDVKIYAKWTPMAFTVSFDPAGGECSETSLDVTFDTPYASLPTPAWHGHTFVGWYTGDTLVTDASVVSVPQKHTLVAHWEIKKVHVTFDPAGGNCLLAAKDVLFGDPYGNLPTAARTGYVFRGWYLNGERVISGTILREEEPRTLTAKWEIATFVYSSEESFKITDEGAWGLSKTTALSDVLNLSDWAEFMNDDYLFTFSVTLRLKEEDDGYQEIFLYNEWHSADDGYPASVSEKMTYEEATALGLVAYHDAIIHTDGKTDKTAWDHEIGPWSVSGEQIRSKMYVKYDAHGTLGDDWIRERLDVTVNVSHK